MTETITLDTRKCESTIGNARIAPLRRGERGNVPLVVFVRRNLRPYDLTDMTAHLVWKAADGKLVGPVPMEVTDPATGIVRCTLPDACYSTVGTARAYVELRRGAELVDTTDEMAIKVLDCIDADAEQAEEYKPLIAEVRESVADAKQATTEAYNAANVANEAAVNANEAAANANNAADRISAYTEIIEQNKKRITSLEGTVSKQGKQIANLQGIVATEETDSTEAYTKTVPTGAQKWASLDKVGGKTVVNDGELVSAEVVEVESKGKNLLDFSTANANLWNVKMVPNQFKAGETYTVSAKEQPSDNNRGFRFYLSRTGMETEKLLTNSYIGKQFSATETFTAPDDCGDYPYLNLAGSTKGVGLEYESFNLMAERGTTATPYSPYGVKGTFQIPAEVRDMCPGYGWSAGTACNEIDFVRKVYVQRVSSVDLGTLVYWNESTDVSGKYRFSSDTVKDIKPNTQNVFTKDLRYNGNTYNYVDGIEISTQGVIYICDSRYETAVDFKAAMQGVLLYYELAEPIEVDLSDVLPDDHFIEVEAGGTVTFKQASTQLPVPSSVTYQISTSEVIANV